jgi:hypothetical protein
MEIFNNESSGCFFNFSMAWNRLTYIGIPYRIVSWNILSYVDLKEVIMAGQEIPDYPRGITFEQVWAAIMEDRIPRGPRKRT